MAVAFVVLLVGHDAPIGRAAAGDTAPSAADAGKDVELLAHGDAELFLDFVRRHFVFVRDELVELDAVFVVHVDAVGVFEFQPGGDVAHRHEPGNDLFVHDVLDVAAVDLDAVPEDVLMRLGGADIRLHAAGHRLRTENEVGDLLVGELDKTGVYLLAVGHGEGLDIHLVFQSRDDDLVLGGIGDVLRQTLAVHVVLADGLAVNDGLAVGVAEIHVVRHGEFLGEDKRCSGGEKTEVAAFDEHILFPVCRRTDVPVRQPQALTLDNDALVGQHVAPLDAVHLLQPTRVGVDVGHDFQQRVAVELGLDDAPDDFVELRALNLLALFHIFDVFALVVLTGEHVPVAENLAFERLDDGTDVRVLLQAGVVQVDQAGTVVEDGAQQHVRAHRTVAVVPFDFPHVFLNRFFGRMEDAFEQLTVKSSFFLHFFRVSKRIVRTRKNGLSETS